MIVIAIIGILAAIAVPNFIAYRNKTFCTAAESDALNAAAALADYFAMPSHVNTTLTGDLNDGRGPNMSNTNTITIAGGSPNTVITIKVTDTSGRCPSDYMGASADWNATSNLFTKLVQ